MADDKKIVPVLLLSIPLLLGIVFTSSSGVLIKDLYLAETPNWAIQTRVQDYVDLFLVAPLLLFSAILAFNRIKMWFVIWAGINLYILYTYMIYCFAVALNPLFLFYCLCLGLSFYSLLFFIHSFRKTDLKAYVNSRPAKKLISIYFIFTAIAFGFLWSSELISFIRTGILPQSLVDTGLRTNPVHVIDLSVLLPGIFVTGILLWRNKYSGMILTPVVLTFLVIMNVTIGLINLFLYREGLAPSMSITWLMAILSVISFGALAWFAAEFRGEKDFGFDFQV